MYRLIHDQKKFTAALLLFAALGLIVCLLHVAVLQIIFVVLTFLLAAFSARMLSPRLGFAANHRPAPVLLLPLPAALFLTVAALIQLFSDRWFAGIANLLCAGSMTVLVRQTVARKVPPLSVYMALTLSIICRLIPDFRAWSVDPLIGDYCFRLFSLISAMLVSFHLGGFVLNKGNRSLTVFYGICGVVFSIMGLAGGGFADILAYLSYTLFLLSEVRSLMRPGRRRKKRPLPPDESAEGLH